jgi:hypothetical protein
MNGFEKKLLKTFFKHVMGTYKLKEFDLDSDSDMLIKIQIL